MAVWEEPTLTDRTILVLGGTPFGRRIACTWVSAGFNVTILEIDVQDRALSVQYVITNLGPYMQTIGSSRHGIISAFGDLDAAKAHNPWLVIDTWYEEPPKSKIALFRKLEAELSDHCIFCVNVMKFSGILDNVKRPYRLLTIHHYLLPNVRVVEMVRTQHTADEVVDFIFKLIPRTGSLPILANEVACAGDFQSLWVAIRAEVAPVRRERLSPSEIDEAWEHFLRITSVRNTGKWILYISWNYSGIISVKKRALFVCKNQGRIC